MTAVASGWTNRRRAALALALLLVAAIAGATLATAARHEDPASGAQGAPRSAPFGRTVIRFAPGAARLRLDRTTGAPIRLGALATVAGSPCGETPGLLCSRVDVPLDRTGVVPGTISLHVETLPAVGTPRGAVFLIAGGPGQGSAHVFGLGSADVANFYRFLFPGYTLVAYDDRGTGDSGVLRCPALQTSVSIDAETDAVLAAECAASLGVAKDFYSTHEHAEDLEAVRQALGVDKVALWGTSYGTKLALGYALAHPDHVERLLLDSVVPTERDTYSTSVLKSMAGTLRGYCSGGVCRSATADLGGDLVTVANRLAAKPVQVKVLQANGKTKTEKINGLGLIAMTIDADLNPGLAAALPAAAHAARLGNLKPLLRLFELDRQGSIVPDEELSAGLYAATVCRDGPFPWQPDAPIADRPALLKAAIAALPAGSLGPFGTWAADLGNASFCVQWPVPSGGAALGPGPLPDVPVLAVSGGFDLRTPTADATLVASRFPQGRVLVVPGVGHSVLGADVSFCSQRAVRDWMLGSPPPASCSRPSLFVATVPAYPAPVSTGKKTKVASPSRTLAIASQAIRDAEALWLMSGPGDQIPGVYSGKLVAGDQKLTLVRYSVTPGIELSGTLRVKGSNLPLRFDGAVRVSGKSAATGLLGIASNKVAGTLNGVVVGS